MDVTTVSQRYSVGCLLACIVHQSQGIDSDQNVGLFVVMPILKILSGSTSVLIYNKCRPTLR